MSKVIGVRFQQAGRVYYFDQGELDISLFERVVVETDQGLEMAWVVIEPDQVVYSEVQGPFKSVLRKATPDDLNLDG